MSDLEARLACLRECADATVFAGLEPTPELEARVLSAVRAVSAPAARTVAPVRRPLLRPRTAGARLVGAAALAALAAAVALEAWPGGSSATAASLSVRALGAAFVVSVSDPHSRAGSDEVVSLRRGLQRAAGVEALPVEVDSASSLGYRWSPDGRRLVYGSRGDLFVYDAETGGTRNITRSPGRWELLPAWSPDGARVAFASRPLVAGEGPHPDRPGGPDWVMIGVFGGAPAVAGVDGGGYRVLERVTITSTPSWSPDGTTLAYATDALVEAGVPAAAERDGLLHLADVASGEVRRLSLALGRGARYLGSPSWSPARHELAVFFSASDSVPTREEILGNTAAAVEQGYALLDPSSGTVSTLYSFTAPFVPRGPATWSDDGEFVALLFRQDTAIAEPVELDVVSRTGAVEARLPGLFAHVDWEPGTHRLAARDDGDEGGVILADVRDGGVDLRRLRFDGTVEELAWRPGRR